MDKKKMLNGAEELGQVDDISICMTEPHSHSNKYMYFKYSLASLKSLSVLI